jgi:hypothetical protein
VNPEGVDFLAGDIIYRAFKAKDGLRARRQSGNNIYEHKLLNPNGRWRLVQEWVLHYEGGKLNATIDPSYFERILSVKESKDLYAALEARGMVKPRNTGNRKECGVLVAASD